VACRASRAPRSSSSSPTTRNAGRRPEPDPAAHHRGEGRHGHRRLPVGITLTASAIAERYGIPFLTPESVAANLTERGFKWFFRTTPVAIDFAKAYSAFLKEQKAAGRKVDSVAIVHENTEYGNSVASVIAEVFGKDGLPVTQNIAYSAQFDRRAAAGAAAQGEESRRPDLHLLHLGRDPLRQDHEGAELEARHHDRRQCRLQRPSFVKAMGATVEGLINRSAFAGGKPGTVPYIFNELYKKKSGGATSTTSRRAARGLPGDGRRHQPRRLDRSGQDRLLWWCRAPRSRQRGH